MPYIKNESIFKCPSDASGAVSYSFNANLAGVKLAKVSAPAETVMIYEGKNGKLDFRHEGKAAVGFADGHAKLVNAEGAKKLHWRP
jgi:prepilin-type processing-associated H-X9-DG protein